VRTVRHRLMRSAAYLSGDDQRTFIRGIPHHDSKPVVVNTRRSTSL